MVTKETHPAPVATESFRKKVEREYAEGMQELREYFLLCDADRERRYNAGDKGVYDEL